MHLPRGHGAGPQASDRPAGKAQGQHGVVFQFAAPRRTKRNRPRRCAPLDRSRNKPNAAHGSPRPPARSSRPSAAGRNASAPADSRHPRRRRGTRGRTRPLRRESGPALPTAPSPAPDGSAGSRSSRSSRQAPGGALLPAATRAAPSSTVVVNGFSHKTSKPALQERLGDCVVRNIRRRHRHQVQPPGIRRKGAFPLEHFAPIAVRPCGVDAATRGELAPALGIDIESAGNEPKLAVQGRCNAVRRSDLAAFAAADQSPSSVSAPSVSVSPLRRRCDSTGYQNRRAARPAPMRV